MVWVRLPVYFYKRNDTFYFSRSIPSDLQHRFKKRKIEVSLRTKSESKAAKSAAALSDRLERYWDSLRMEMIYSRELGLSVAPQTKRQDSNDFSLTDALSLYHRLKGAGKTKLFFEVSGRSIRYLTECLGHDNLSMLKVSDGGQFRDFLFDRGMSSSSVNRRLNNALTTLIKITGDNQHITASLRQCSNLCAIIIRIMLFRFALIIPHTPATAPMMGSASSK